MWSRSLSSFEKSNNHLQNGLFIHENCWVIEVCEMSKANGSFIPTFSENQS